MTVTPFARILQIDKSEYIEAEYLLKHITAKQALVLIKLYNRDAEQFLYRGTKGTVAKYAMNEISNYEANSHLTICLSSSCLRRNTQ